MNFTRNNLDNLSLIHFHCAAFLQSNAMGEYDETTDYNKLVNNKEKGQELLSRLNMELQTFYVYCEAMTPTEVDIVLKSLQTLSLYIMFLGMQEAAPMSDYNTDSQDYINDCLVAGEQYEVALYFIRTQIYSKYTDDFINEPEIEEDQP